MKKRFWSFVSAVFTLGLLLASAPTHLVTAFDPFEYFSVSYGSTISLSEVSPGQIFNITVTGTAVCTKNLPFSPGDAVVTGRIIARHEGGTQIILANSYTVSMGGFPSKAGQSMQASETVIVSLPPGSPTGRYTLRGELIEAKVQIVIWFNVSSYLPSSEDFGSISLVNLPPPPQGGGGGGFGSQLVGIGLSGTSPFMDGNGRALTAGQIRTPDGKLSLTILVGTYVWNAAGAAQSFLSATPLTEPPQAPPQHALILAYEMGPSGVTFNPAITLTMSYTDDQIPAGTRETDLYIAWWDGAQWVKLEGTVDTAANTITVQVTHFNTFALLAAAPPAPPPPPPTVNISTPVAGATFDSGNVTLSISVQNLKLVTGERPNAPGEGCVIYYLDVPIPTTPGQSAFSALGTFKETDATSNTWTNLAPGIHILGVQLVQNDHTPFNPPVFATVSVTIKEAASPQTTAVPAPPPVPPSDGTKTNWIIIVSLLIAALILGIVLYWRARRLRYFDTR